MVASLKKTQSKDKDYTLIFFTSKGSFLDIMSMVDSKEEEAMAYEEDILVRMIVFHLLLNIM